MKRTKKPIAFEPTKVALTVASLGVIVLLVFAIITVLATS